MRTIRPAVPLPLEPRRLNELVEDAKDFAFGHGLVSKIKNVLPYSYSVSFIPFALLPSPWPKDQYHLVYSLQRDINILYYKVTNDYDFLHKSLGSTCQVDAWTARLFKLYEVTRQSQKDVPSLCILRSDYMVGNEGSAKQIEVNTISCGFGGVSPIVQAQQRYVISKLHQLELGKLLPENPGTRVALGLAQAWKAYGNPEAVVCFVVEDTVYNTYDQRMMEFALIDKYGVDAHLVIRRTNADFAKAKINEGKLFMDDKEVAVLYLRTWYDPSQLETEEVWKIREMVEASKAIKCPNVAWHLAGCKKIQQELARPGVLEKFCEDGEQVKRIREVFAGLYALEEKVNYDMVMKSPEKFVLKPQREGGGNNIYGTDIPAFVSKLSVSQRQEYIAMDIVKPIESMNYLVARDQVKYTDVVNELGVFGYVLGDSKRILQNETDCGWIFRAKDSSSKEGGVAAGFGYLDTPFLI